MSIHERDASVLTRDFVGHWEGDFVKGAGNKSAIGTLVERKSRYTLIAKMDDCSAQSALTSFSQAFSRLPQALRKTFTYDCGTEMAKHKEGGLNTEAQHIATRRFQLRRPLSES